MRLSLFWRVFAVNAGLLGGIAVLLLVSPIEIDSPIRTTQALIVVAGLAITLATNAVLLRRAFMPLERLRARSPERAWAVVGGELRYRLARVREPRESAALQVLRGGFDLVEKANQVVCARPSRLLSTRVARAVVAQRPARDQEVIRT